MNTERLYRIAGLGLVAAGAVGAMAHAVTDVLDQQQPQPLGDSIAAGVLMGADILVVLCLPAIAARQAARAGWLGLVGYALFGVVFQLFGVANEFLRAMVVRHLPAALQASPPPELVASWLVGAIIRLAGLASLGVATVRAGVFPAWTGWLLVASSAFLVLTFAPLPAAPVSIVHDLCFYTALIGMGIVLVRPALSVPSQRGALSRIAG